MKISIRAIISTLFCIYIAAIFFLCMMNGDNVPDIQMNLLGIPMDKVAHFCMFVPYPILSFMTFQPVEAPPSRKTMLLAVLVISGAVIAYATEQLQGMTGYRTYEIKDFYADLVGLATGTLAVLAYLSLKRK